MRGVDIVVPFAGWTVALYSDNNNKKFSPRTRWSLCLDATSQFSAGTIEKALEEEESDQLVW